MTSTTKPGATVELTDVAAIASRISGIGSGIVSLDGAPRAGKSWLMRDLAIRLGCEAIDLDDHLDEDRRTFVGAMRLKELNGRLDTALAVSPVVLVAGVCMREVLDRLGRSAALSIYVQRNTPTGLPGDLEMLDAEDGNAWGTSAALDTLVPNGGVLHREVRHYHGRYKPRRNADLVFVNAHSS